MGIPQLGSLAIAGGVALLSAACTFSIDVGETVTKSFDVEDFHELEIRSAFDVDVTIGDETSVSFDVGEDVVDRLNVEVVDGRLFIDFDGGFLKTSGPLDVRITTPTLSAIDVDGAIDMEIEGLAAEDLDITMEGASKLEANGAVDTLTLSVGGATDVDLDDVSVGAASVDIDGASSVKITDAQSVTGSIDGASSIKVPNTGTVDVDSSGVSSVDVG